MTIAALVGDGTTTTAVALAAVWPTTDPVTVVEADPEGGSLAAWLDTPRVPSLGTIVANMPRGAAGAARSVREPRDARTVIEIVDTMTHRSETGIAVVAAPVRSVAAARAVDEAGTVVFPALAATTELIALVDAGRHLAGARPHPALECAGVVVVVHQQARMSSGAAAVRLERHLESLERIAALRRPVLPVLIGTEPFDPDEIDEFVASSLPAAAPSQRHLVLADDPLAAATIAGRTGVSSRRLRRLPLMRSAAGLATRLARLLEESPDITRAGARETMSSSVPEEVPR